MDHVTGEKMPWELPLAKNGATTELLKGVRALVGEAEQTARNRRAKPDNSGECCTRDEGRI